MLRKRPSRMKKSASPPSVMPSDRPTESFSLQGGRVHPDLEALLVLQDADVAVANCDVRLKALEPEVRALDEQVAAGERIVAQARAGIQAALDRRDGLEGKIQSYRTMQEQRRQRLEWVRGAKEASTLMVALERQGAAKNVNPSLLARYNRIRQGKAPLAIYPLHGSSCGNCFTAVPTQRKSLIQRGATIEGCEACGVLLYAKE